MIVKEIISHPNFETNYCTTSVIESSVENTQVANRVLRVCQNSEAAQSE